MEGAPTTPDESPDPQAAAQVQPRGQVRPGRFASLAGLLLLCVGFFLPQVEGCSRDIVPAQATVDTGGAFLLTAGLPFLAAALLAPVCACYALAWRLRSPQAERVLAIVICTVCLTVLTAATLLVLAPVTAAIMGPSLNGSDLLIWLLFLAITALPTALGALGVAACRMPRKAASALFGLGLACLGYFAVLLSLLFSEGAMYGLWLSAGGSLLVFAGAGADWIQSGPLRPPAGSSRPCPVRPSADQERDGCDHRL